jgi:crotonobetainyl-CoA:carnitine CoA-transferase CaiB-like acyl-CoA transferase
VAKIEPPDGDPFEAYCPAWYRRLHAGLAVRRLDLKSDAGRASMEALLANADILVTAQRPAALARLGLDAASLAERHPRICHVAITGHAPPDEDKPGHDLTYMAAHGLVTPPALPPTLFADMAGAEHAVSTALALVIRRERTGRGAARAVPLEEAVRALSQPLREGLTRAAGLLGGGLPGYNVYAASDGWIAVAVLEPRFAKRLASELGLASLGIESLRAKFATASAAHWERWARDLDLPLVALHSPSPENGP